jgi:hypothetical protein
MWSIVQSDQFKHGVLQIDPSHTRFADAFGGILVTLAGDPYDSETSALLDDEQQRLITSRNFMPGFELFVGYLVNDDAQTVILDWIERVPDEGPYGAYDVE